MRLVLVDLRVGWHKMLAFRVSGLMHAVGVEGWQFRMQSLRAYRYAVLDKVKMFQEPKRI